MIRKENLLFYFLVLLMNFSCMAQDTIDHDYKETRYLISYSKKYGNNYEFYTIIIDRYGNIIKEFPKNHKTSVTDPNFFNASELPLIMHSKTGFYLTDRNGLSIDVGEKYEKFYYDGGRSSTKVHIKGFVYERDHWKKEYLDAHLKVVIKANEFDHLSYFNENVAVVLRKGKMDYELINPLGQSIAELGNTEDIYNIHSSKGGYIRTERYDGSYYFLDHNGNIALDVYKALQKNSILSNRTVKRVYDVNEGLVLLKFNKHKENYRYIAYLKMNGKILFYTEIEDNDNAHIFEHNYALIIGHKHTVEEYMKINDIKHGETKSFLGESNNYYIDTLANRYYGDDLSDIFQNEIGEQKGELKGLNRGIYNLITCKMIFTKNPKLFERNEKYQMTYERDEKIIYFDKNIVIVNTDEYIAPKFSNFITVYDYNDHVLWTEGSNKN